MGYFSNAMRWLPSALLLLTGLFSTRTVYAGTLVQFHFFFGVNQYIGDVDVELYDQDKPATVNNFLRLVKAGAYPTGIYPNSIMHRCQPNFVLQGGGFFVGNSLATNVIGPPYANMGSVGNFGNITNEFKVGKFYSNTNWTIAMAKTSDPNSANSQFFFNLTNNAGALDSTNNSGGFTVFGHTLRGTNVLGFFNTLSTGHGVVDLTQTYGPSGALFSQLPNEFVGTNPPPYYGLVYFTISLLSEQVKVQTNGARQITWTPIIGETNSVEYSSNLPPVWHLLTNVYTTNVNVTTTNVIDSTTNKTRFYRVHVLYPNTPPS